MTVPEDFVKVFCSFLVKYADVSFGQMINPVSPFLFRFRDLEQSTELALIRTPGAGTMCLS